MSYPIQKAGSASDVTTKNKIQVEYGNILAQQLAVEAGIQGRVTYVSGGAGSSSTLLSASQGNTLFTIAELQTVVANIISNTATNSTQANALASAANRKLGITVNLTTNISLVWSPRTITGLSVWLDGADPAGTGSAPANGSAVTTWVDKSGNGYNTTSVVGTPTYSSTSGIIFNGLSYFNLPNGSIPFNNTSYTIYSVVNFTDIIGNPGWFGAGAAGTSQSISMRYQTSYILIYWYGNDFVTSSAPSTGVTFLFSTQFQTGGQRTAFINGTASGSDTPSARSQPNTGNTIGRAIDSAYINGSIRDILVYNTNHTTDERQQVEGYLAWKWGLQVAAADFNPIIRLLLETDTLNTGTTSTTRAATNTGSVTVGTNVGQLSASFSSGKFLTIPFTGITQAPFSVSYWFNPLNGGEYNAWTLSLNNDWVINPDIVNGSQAFYTRFSGAFVGPGFNFSPVSGVWNHVTLTIDATATTFGVMKSYLNGVLKGTVTANANGTLQNAQLLYVGKSDARIYNGYIRRFRVHDFVLSQAQITSLYNQDINILQSTHPYSLAPPL